ncbi:MAG: hypothetical protein HDS84_02205 [Bacteroidales bacterium]|nr:hypothetical protein [Bacteroidales bacterium]MBD5205174.1 hypothetical protein [Bacteroidales bacterium]
MIDDELMKKFDSIEELPISEEMLGAYLEGNLSDAESIVVNNTIDSFSELSSIIAEIPSIEDFTTFELYNEKQDFNEGSVLEDVELPSISSLELADTSSICTDEFIIQSTLEDVVKVDSVYHLDPSSLDDTHQFFENNLFSDDNSTHDSNSLELNDNSDSLSDEDMFNSNIDF